MPSFLVGSTDHNLDYIHRYNITATLLSISDECIYSECIVLDQLATKLAMHIARAQEYIAS